jgi:hypothetical protein
MLLTTLLAPIKQAGGSKGRQLSRATFQDNHLFVVQVVPKYLAILLRTQCFRSKVSK